MTLLFWLGIGASRVLYLVAVIPAFIGGVCACLVEESMAWDEYLVSRLRYRRIAVARKRLDKALGKKEQ